MSTSQVFDPTPPAPSSPAAMKRLPHTGAVTEDMTKVTAGELVTMMDYLRRSRDRAVIIRDNAPAGSYLESVLTRTISGINHELAQLTYLLARRDLQGAHPARMRPAI